MKVAAYTMKTHLWSDKSEWSSSCGVGWGTSKFSPQTINVTKFYAGTYGHILQNNLS